MYKMLIKSSTLIMLKKFQYFLLQNRLLAYLLIIAASALRYISSEVSV